MPSCWGSIRFAKYLEIHSNEFYQIFRDFGGSAYDPESVKISGSNEGVLREGVGKKKVWPPISPLLRGRGSQIFFFLGGADRGYLAVKIYEATPYGGSPPKIETVSKNFGGGYLNTGVLRGLPLSECRKIFFDRLRRKYPQPFFSFFQISTQGLKYAPSNNGQIFDQFWPKIHAGLIWTGEGLGWIKIHSPVAKLSAIISLSTLGE